MPALLRIALTALGCVSSAGIGHAQSLFEGDLPLRDSAVNARSRDRASSDTIFDLSVPGPLGLRGGTSRQAPATSGSIAPALVSGAGLPSFSEPSGGSPPFTASAKPTEYAERRAAAATAQPASAPVPPPERRSGVETKSFVYVLDEDLRSFLSQFARRVGLRPDIAANVRGKLARLRLPTETTALLSELDKRFEIEWMIDGDYLRVSSRSELATRILPLESISYDDLTREMKAANISNARYPLRKMPGSNAVMAVAPVHHVARIAALVEALKAGKGAGSDLVVIRAGVPTKVRWE